MNAKEQLPLILCWGTVQIQQDVAHLKQVEREGCSEVGLKELHLVQEKLESIQNQTVEQPSLMLLMQQLLQLGRQQPWLET